ncbi:SCO family protein [Comamonas thiooxydans]|nr:SCO family protein [Comamonas thiooxydans]
MTGCKDDSKPKFQGVDVTGADYAKDIPLTDVHGKKRSLKDFSGKVVAVFFGYTQCPDVCPTTLQELLEVKQALGADGDKLQAVFVSLDPERDTPEVLKAYLANFDESFVGLSGTVEEIAAVAKDFKIFFKKVPGKVDGTYTLDHSAGTYLFDPQGRLRVYERYGAGPQLLTQDVKALLG